MEEEKNTEIVSEESKKAENRSNIIFTIIAIAVVLICGIFIFENSPMAESIYLFDWSMKDEYTDRIDSIDGYYAKIGLKGCGVYTKDGNKYFSFDGLEEDADYDWSYQELDTVSFYKKNLCFSSYSAVQNYQLTDDDGKYLGIYVSVLKGKSGTYHYFFKRTGTFVSSYSDESGAYATIEILTDENFDFRFNGQALEVINHYRFDSDTDFTSDDAILYLGDRACHFVKWL